MIDATKDLNPFVMIECKKKNCRCLKAIVFLPPNQITHLPLPKGIALSDWVSEAVIPDDGPAVRDKTSII